MCQRCEGGLTTRPLPVCAAASACVLCVSRDKLQREDIKNKRKVSDSSMISPSACLSRFVHQQNKKRRSHQQPSICWLACLYVTVCLFFFPRSQSTQAGFSRDFGGISNDSLSAAALTPTG